MCYEDVCKLSEAPALAEYVATERARLRESFLQAPSGRSHSETLASLFDAVVRRLFSLANAEARAQVPPTEVAVAILATGGYGRRELCPHSDIDLAVIASEEEDPYLDAFVRRVFYLIMDVFTVRSDLKVGYSFRIAGERADLDPQTCTALLDARRIVGDAELARRFQRELLGSLRPGAFWYDRARDREAMRRKHGNVVHRAEPHLKEGAGGLRDLHFIEWSARVRSPEPLEDPLAYLVATGDIEPTEREALAQAHDFLLRVRHALHYACGRRFDTLSRARQPEVAATLGFATVGDLMERYFQHAETVSALANRVTEQTRRLALPLEKGLVVQNGEIVVDPHAQWHDLADVLSLFRQSQICKLPLRADAGRRIANFVARIPSERVGRAACRMFLEILRAEDYIEATLRQMVQAGVLQRILPEFAEALHLVPMAPVHEYTVGEHSLRVIGLLEEMRHSDTHSHLATLFSEIQRTDLLFLAALLHDLGKRAEGIHHAEAGALKAEAIARRLGLEPEAVAKVAYLVRHHLLMSDTARLRDLTQEETIRHFTALVPTLEHLNPLFLLTYADLRATGGGVWTPVHERFLEDLYYRAQRVLAVPEPDRDREARWQRQRRRVERELAWHRLPTQAVQEHCNAMPPAYLLNTPLETIAQHIRLVERLKAEGPVVEFRDAADRSYTLLTLCTFDDPQPGLLSRIAAALYAHRVNIHAAQVFTRDGNPGIAIDTLWIDVDGRGLYPFERAEVERDLRDVLAGHTTGEALLARRGKPPDPDLSEAEVRVYNDVSETHTVIEVRCPDRPGLLYRLTRRFSELGWDIHWARISTVGDEARDAFYVTANGAKLKEDAETVRALLLAQRNVS